MSLIKVRGIVLREAYCGEADKIITILTKEKGKIAISAKGAKRPQSPFMAGTQIFSYCDFLLYGNREIAKLSQVEIIESFHNIRNDLFKLSYATYFMELLENIFLEEIPTEASLKLTLKTLQVLSKTEYDVKLVAAIYELRLMAIIGYMPETIRCVNCLQELGEEIYFSSELGGTLCPKCKNVLPTVMKISKSTLYAVQYILSSQLSELFKFSLSDSVLKELTLLTREYVILHTERKFKALEFIEKL